MYDRKVPPRISPLMESEKLYCFVSGNTKRRIACYNARCLWQIKTVCREENLTVPDPCQSFENVFVQ